MEEIIGHRYKILKPLGRGSFGNVYLADDLRFVRRVVLKLSSGPLEPGDLDVFQREALVSARLIHPNIADVYDFGVATDDRPYIVREYVEGTSLEELLTGGRKLEVPDALAVARSIADGLKAAHDLGIIHRDLKPSNLIIPMKGSVRQFDRAKITDFGVFGKLLRKRGSDQAFTMAGELYGTPKYMAPEQLKAEGQTAATDIYGLGLVLYEMIYGGSPFPTGSIVEMMRAKVYGTIDYPSERGIRPEVVALLKQCLQTEAKDRIQTAVELSGRLAELGHTYTRSREGPKPTIVISGPRAHTTTSDEAPPTLTMSERGPDLPVGDLQINARAAGATESDIPWQSSSQAQERMGPGLWKKIIVGFVAFVSVPLLSTIGWFLWQAGLLNWGTAIGLALVLVGVGGAFVVNRFAKSKQTEIGRDAQDLLFGTKSRDLMTQSLAIQVDALLSKITREDDKILGMSLALMVHEFAETKKSENRGEKLMNVVLLLEKISVRLSPWYVRHEKFVTVIAAAVGTLGVLTTITVTVMNSVKK